MNNQEEIHGSDHRDMVRDFADCKRGARTAMMKTFERCVSCVYEECECA